MLEIRDKSLVKYPTIFRTEYFHNLRLKIGYKAPKQAQVFVCRKIARLMNVNNFTSLNLNVQVHTNLNKAGSLCKNLNRSYIH